LYDLSEGEKFYLKLCQSSFGRYWLIFTDGPEYK